MGDSENEYDRKRRDKFRGAERAPRPREDWVERENWPRDYRPRDRGYSPSIEPAPKRMRHDYYGAEGGGFYNHYGAYHQAAAHR
ncbi:unnamed protein product [Ceutorhynchus assimilis]|uniref:Uncharacterized protein n=1 Tax=Ceutorhynchus assimilis TaxID=467358 RepID=A0A9N9MJW7_9CUCU|nr:unnamed protein product [Ceutorhynchus assimilis]